MEYIYIASILCALFSKSQCIPLGVSLSQTSIVAPLSNLGENVDNKIKQVVHSGSVNYGSPFPNSGRQQAVLESKSRESIPIQADIKYGNLQQFVAGIVNPKPIVDTIQEHEKYGNDGGKFNNFGKLIVGAFEGLSNALNTAVDVPFTIAKEAGRKVTAQLNRVGGKLVGLA